MKKILFVLLFFLVFPNLSFAYDCFNFTNITKATTRAEVRKIEQGKVDKDAPAGMHFVKNCGGLSYRAQYSFKNFKAGEKATVELVAYIIQTKNKADTDLIIQKLIESYGDPKQTFKEDGLTVNKWRFDNAFLDAYIEKDYKEMSIHLYWDI